MTPCDTCQAQLLDHLYDLLEADERRALELHLEGCPACQAALDRAREQQQLLAAAARMEFPQVCFTAPAEAPAAQAVTPAPAEPGPATVIPLRQRTRPIRRNWMRWAVAAAVLLGLAGVGASTSYFGYHYTQAQARVREHEDAVAQAQEKIRRAQAALGNLPARQQEQINAIQEEVRKRQLKMIVTGPETVQAGAPTVYDVATLDPLNRIVEAEVEARLADGTGKVSEPLPVRKVAQGRYRVTVPPDQAPQPGGKMTLVAAARRPEAAGGAEAELKETLELARPVFLTHLLTDKPMYQPGETVHFRSLTLDRFSLKPAEEDLHLRFSVQPPQGPARVILRGGARLVRSQEDGSLVTVKGPDDKPLQGVGAGEFPLTPEAPGGQYTLTVEEEMGRFPRQQATFLVNRYQKHQINKELDYGRKTYGPGDEVSATFKAHHARGGPVKGRPVSVVVNVDGKIYDVSGKENPAGKPIEFQLDNQGEAVFRFRLPAAIETGRASLTATVNDGANVEALVRPIPIVLKKLLVDFYPEGGDLVAGLPARVYFQVRTPLGKPADLEGELLRDGKPTGVTLQTLNDEKEPGVNQGMGAFAFTPTPGGKYEVGVTSPAGIAQKIALPEIHPEGVVLSVPDGVVPADGPIRVQVRSTGERSLLVGSYVRGRLLASKKLGKGETEAVLEPASGAGGVCRVTVFEEVPGNGDRKQLKPVAERLIYRHPVQGMKVAIQPDKEHYVPGEKVGLRVTAQNEKDEPAPAVVLLSVVDKTVVTMADDKTRRSMPTHFLLTTEVREPEDLEYADFLLGPHEKAPRALDLLLGTQGWRRFAEQDPGKFRREHKEEAQRLLVMTGQSQPKRIDFVQEEIARVRTEMAKEQGKLQEQVAASQEALARARADEDSLAASALVARYDARWEKARLLAPPILGAILLLTALVCLTVALAREARRVAPLYVTAAVCAAGLFLLAWTYPFADLLPRGGRGDAERMAMAPGAARAPDDRDEAAAPPREADKLKGEAAGVAGGPVPDVAGPRMAPQAVPEGTGVPPPAPAAPLAPLAGVPVPPGIPADPLKGRNPAKPAVEGKDGGAIGDGKADAGNREDRGRAFNLRMMRPAGGKEMRDLPAAGDLAPGGLPPGGEPGRFGGGGFGGRAGFAPGGGGGAAPFGGPAGFGPGFRPMPLPPLVVREYAHTRIPGSTPEERSDFKETLFWHPVLVLPGGEAKVSFELCDSVTTFEVTAYAHTTTGRVGSAMHTFASRLPFTLQPKTPLEVTAGDIIELPLSVTNNTGQNRKVDLSLTQYAGLKLLAGREETQFSVPAEKAVRQLFRFRPTMLEGEAELAFRGKTEPFASDAVKVGFRVVPDGFPRVIAQSEVLEGSASEEITLPDTWIDGSLTFRAEVYPSTLADLQKGLDGLLREPNGCFEQTSTSNYPNLLILDYLQETDQALPEVEKRARALLDRGYQKLTSFECRDPNDTTRRGYEWFGGTAPPHEALTAYGLMQFRDLSRVREVDAEMVERTQKYLMSRKDGKGGFRRNPRALDSFGGAPDHVTNAYIVWALTEGSDRDDVSKELNALVADAKDSKDPYYLALIANSLINRARAGEALPLLQKVADAQQEDGRVTGAETSITRSGGRTLEIETTALAVLAWLRAQPGTFNPQVQKAIRWIGTQRGGYGGYGSTQSTILAMKALIAFTRANKKTPEAGEIRLHVNGKLAATAAFEAGTTGTLALPVEEPTKFLKAGKNQVRLEITGKNVFPYTVTCAYRTRTPASAEGCAVRLTTDLDRAEVEEGDSVRLKVKMKNVSGKGQGMAVAIVGLPGGLTLPEDMKQLKEYIRLPKDGSRPLVSAFEVLGRELVLYWRDLAPDQEVEVPVDLICRVPGEYGGPASRGYLYYDADQKHWVEPLKVKITSKGE